MFFQKLPMARIERFKMLYRFFFVLWGTFYRYILCAIGPQYFNMAIRAGYKIFCRF